MKPQGTLFLRQCCLVFCGVALLGGSSARAAVVNRKITLSPSAENEEKWEIVKPKPNKRLRSMRDPASLSPEAATAGGSETSEASTAVETGMGGDSALSPDAGAGVTLQGLDGSDPGSATASGKAAPSNKPVKIDMNKLPVFKELITPEMVESAYPRPLQSDRHWYISGGGTLGAGLSDRMLGSFAIGRQGSFTDIFLKARIGNAIWGGMQVRPATVEAVDGTAFPSFSDPNSEYNRFRLVTDPWSVLEVQLGLGWRGTLLPVILPGFSQAFHVTLGSGQYQDLANELVFTPMLLGFEAAMQWHIGSSRAWGLEGRVGYNFGSLSRNDAKSGQLGLLPVRWADGSLNLVLWF